MSEYDVHVNMHGECEWMNAYSAVHIAWKTSPYELRFRTCTNCHKDQTFSNNHRFVRSLLVLSLDGCPFHETPSCACLGLVLLKLNNLAGPRMRIVRIKRSSAFLWTFFFHRRYAGFGFLNRSLEMQKMDSTQENNPTQFTVYFFGLSVFTKIYSSWRKSLCSK